ncbi:hypothetical protein [Solibacillus sp. NPDC093137]|uniref:hypothetical protein n=1 Tax=Solibacillus sp. NPDC093137 TaxID=3390678 RepID=UPI003D07B0CE
MLMFQDGHIPLGNFRNLKNKIQYHHEIQKSIYGDYSHIIFSEFKEIYAVYYSGENAITENPEGYINFFFGKEISIININKIIKLVLNTIEKNEQLFCIYISLFSEDESYQAQYIENENYKLINAALSSIFVKKDLEQSPKIKENNMDYELELCEPDDKENVLKCIEEAYFNGTETDLYKNIGIDGFKKNIRDYYENILDDYHVFIAKHNGYFCGHITYEVREGNANLIDVYSLENHKVNDFLSEESEYIMRTKNVKKIEGSVKVVNNNTQRTFDILLNITKKDWDIDGLLFNLKVGKFSDE